MSLETNIESSEHSRTSPTDANFFQMDKDFSFHVHDIRRWIGCLLVGKHSTEGGFLTEKIIMWEILIIVKLAL